MKITIIGFKKFNPRSDLKSMPWLRLQNDFYDKEDFFDEDVNTTWLFIFLLCQCAQKVSDSIEFSEKYMITKSKLKKNDFRKALTRLLDKHLISLDTNESDRISTDSCLTNEQNEQNEHDRDRSREFDITVIYDTYPKKIGKAKGLEKLNKIIKDQKKYDEVLHGVKKYCDYVLKENIEKKYIKQFDTWVNQESWNDECTIDYQDAHDPFADDRLKSEFFNEI